MPHSVHFATERYEECYILRNVETIGPVAGTFAGREFFDLIRDEWRRPYRFAGVASFRRNGRYDCDVLRVGEFILPPGLIYRMVSIAAQDAAAGRQGAARSRHGSGGPRRFWIKALSR